ncbi:MAG: hypothetical protein MST00_04480 [Tenericutes bacterium]|nr:hypothetical protein [Mycoplasmatota bacterium]
MKKCLLLLTLIFLCGCTNIQEARPQDLIKEIVSSKNYSYNEYRTGYKYYLPLSMSCLSSKKYNEILTDGNYKYYLYVDLVSYLKKNEFSYTVNENAYLSETINYNNLNGYFEVNERNDKYLIEIMYNYAKIEVIVDKDDINKVIVNSMIVLTTIDYTDDVIKNLLSIDDMSSSEENFSLFDESNDSNLLEVIKPGDYVDKDEVPDPDVIN